MTLPGEPALQWVSSTTQQRSSAGSGRAVSVPSPIRSAAAPSSAGFIPPTSAGFIPPTSAGFIPPTSAGFIPPTSAVFQDTLVGTFARVTGTALTEGNQEPA